MMLRSSLVALFVVLVVAAPASAAAPTANAAASPPGCVRAREHVVVRSADVIVVRGRKRRTEGGWTRPLLGCVRATARRVRLASDGRLEFAAAFSNRRFAVGGTTVAWMALQYGKDDTEALIQARDLRGGRPRVWSVPADTLPDALVVDGAGRVAYASAAGVFVLDAPFVRRVDRGVVAGLGIEGEDVVWSHADEVRRAPLAPPVDGCVPLRDDFAATATSEVVLAQRNSGLGATSHTDVLACLRTSWEFVAIGRNRGRTAGTIAAAEQPDGTVTAVAPPARSRRPSSRTAPSPPSIS